MINLIKIQCIIFPSDYKVSLFKLLNHKKTSSKENFREGSGEKREESSQEETGRKGPRRRGEESQKEEKKEGKHR